MKQMPIDIYMRDDGDDGIELTSDSDIDATKYVKYENQVWYNCDNVKPPINENILVFRPQVLTEDHSDKPIRQAQFDGKKYDCHFQPTHWQPMSKPLSWNDDLENRQNFRP